jgi:HlyD family secretion protein
MHKLLKKIPAFTKSKWFLGVGIPVVLIVGYFLFFRHAQTYQFVEVKKGSVTESVSITGNTTPEQSVSLAFNSSGIVSSTYSALGRRVSVGQVLAELNTNDLVAQLRQAEANVSAQKAKLQGLQAGTRPEDVAASKAALDKVKQDLANMYTGIGDTSIDAYAKANDAIRIQLNSFYSNSETQNPVLTFTTANSQALNDSQTERFNTSIALNLWQGQISNIDQSNAGLEALLDDEITYLTSTRQLLNNLSKTLDSAPSLSATTVSTYKTNLSVALNEVNTAVKNLNTISQSISSQKLTVAQLQAQLDLKNVGALPTDISAQQAQVEQAQANVESMKAKIQNAQIVAPITGTVTQFDAKIGQFASPSVPLVSIISDSGYEVDAGVSETDVGKILVGDIVSMTLDAFPNETFAGSVFYLAPAETNTQGVINYQVKIAFAKADSRLKSGLTANIDIVTKRKDNVLVLPQYAILQNDLGTFVEVIENGVTKQNPVKLGVQDQKGNVEVISGVTEGEQVLNIGLKVQQ